MAKFKFWYYLNRLKGIIKSMFLKRGTKIQNFHFKQAQVNKKIYEWQFSYIVYKTNRVSS